jgi:hypothetical protein
MLASLREESILLYHTQSGQEIQKIFNETTVTVANLQNCSFSENLKHTIGKSIKIQVVMQVSSTEVVLILILMSNV